MQKETFEKALSLTNEIKACKSTLKLWKESVGIASIYIQAGGMISDQERVDHRGLDYKFIKQMVITRLECDIEELEKQLDNL